MRLRGQQRHLAKEIALVKIGDHLAVVLDGHLPGLDQIERVARLTLANDRGAARVGLRTQQSADPGPL
jgi:hypothetical protein